MLRPLVPLALLASLALAGCTTRSTSDDSTGEFRGDQRLVANTVEDFESAASEGDQDKICRDLLARALVAQYTERGGSCERAVDGALKDTDSFEMTVERVTITGTQASVRVKSDRGKKDLQQSLTLVRQGQGWRISGFGTG
jgi:outer membrane PBP1 activator LpoA protein